MASETYLAALEAIECGVCGIPFAFPQDLVAKRRADGRDFWCPNGHKIAYGDTEVKRLRRQLKEAEASASRWESRAEVRERQRRAAKGQLTKFKNRIAKGICPRCQQHFPDLEAHMTTEHPDYVGGAADAS